MDKPAKPHKHNNGDEVVHFRVSAPLYKALKRIAEREHRAINNMVYVFVLEGIEKRKPE